MAEKKLMPLATMEKLLKHCGAERVAESAKDALKDVLEVKAEQIAAHAIKLASHAGRKTIKAGDIKLAARS